MLGAVADADLADWKLQDKLAAIDHQHPLLRICKAFLAYQENNFKRSAELFEKALSPGKGLASLPAVYKV